MADLPGSIKSREPVAKYAMLAMFCYMRTQIVTDNMIDLLIKLILVLCGIEWVIKLKLTAKKVNHINKILSTAITSGSSFRQLNLAVDAF